MRQAGQGETAVGEAHPLGVVAESTWYAASITMPFVLGDGLPARFLDAMLQDELMNLGHVGTVPSSAAAPQRWTLCAQAIRRYLIFSY